MQYLQVHTVFQARLYCLVSNYSFISTGRKQNMVSQKLKGRGMQELNMFYLNRYECDHTSLINNCRAAFLTVDN